MNKNSSQRNLKKNRTTILIIVGIVILFTILNFQIGNSLNLDDDYPQGITKIYDINHILISELYLHKYDFTPMDKIPEYAIQAFKSVEVIDNISIASELSRIENLYMKRTMWNNFKNFFSTLNIKLKYSKKEILLHFMNRAYFGHGIYSINSAAKFYFNKKISECNLAECSLLASLIAAPNRYSPIRHPKDSFQKHRKLLLNMVKMGFISEGEADKAYLNFWPDYLNYISDLNYSATGNPVIREPAFTRFIEKILISRYGYDAVYKTGLNVYTTLDLKMQYIAKQELKKAIKEQSDALLIKLEKSSACMPLDMIYTTDLMSLIFDINIPEYYITAPDISGCIITIDHKSGSILAVTDNYDVSLENGLIFQMNEIGSLIHPFLYAIAYENSTLTQHNFDEKNNILFSYSADSKGVNTILEKTKITSIQEYLIKLFNIEKKEIDARIPNKLLSLQKGNFKINLMELSTAFSIIANDGCVLEPFLIHYIKNHRGEIIYNNKTDGNILSKHNKEIRSYNIIKSKTAGILKGALRKNYNGKKRPSNISIKDAAGIQGSSEQCKNVWYIGYTQNLTTGIWMGQSGNLFLQKLDEGCGFSALPLWDSYTKKITGMRKSVKNKKR